jgi:hypothetical protein
MSATPAVGGTRWSLYHVGIVVPDLRAAQRQLSEQVGVTWGRVLHLGAAEARGEDDRDLTLPMTICYSIDEPRLELIEEVPGSVWRCNSDSNLHHIGFWSDDLPGASARLSELGCPMQLCGRAGAEAPRSFAYHYGALGVRIEVVDAALRSTMESLLFAPEHD